MENVHRDLHDGIVKEKRLKFREGDANAFNNLFTVSSAQPFFHSSRFDESNVMKDVMWVDARSQVAYKEFGDVVWFDSSGLTNDYELPLVNLLGVNHHGQSVLFGCALLSHADVDTFQWLFRTWLQCMCEKPPGGIVTDQDASIRTALKIVMPTTRHRWHIGHILTKFSNKFRRHERYFELKEVLHNVISYSVTPEEFENGWNSVLKEFRLESSDWLTGLYGEREMWVPACMNNVIWAGMEINRRVQSEQGFFAGCLQKHTRLSESAPQYCNVLKKKVYDEELEDAMTEKYRRQIENDFLVERVFQKLYTDAKFKEVQSESTRLLYVHVCCWKKKILSDHLLEYPVEDLVWKFCQTSKKEILTDHRRMYKVIFDSSSNEINCDCKLFEYRGVLCRHIIRVYDFHRVAKIPEKYILRRWRKGIMRRHTLVKVPYYDPPNTGRAKRYAKLIAAFEPLCIMASASEETTAMVIEFLKKLKIQLEEKIAIGQRTEISHT